ncbi:hypothetical protein EHH60_26165 [Bradyrhizobium sp. RP6]|nr:hypothetical protein EHH60_26165 [Bradyrhizobium sp. RP6]
MSDGSAGGGAGVDSLHSSLRAKRSNPESFRGNGLDCFVARAPRNDDGRSPYAFNSTVLNSAGRITSSSSTSSE